jgi:hypothetical protein
MAKIYVFFCFSSGQIFKNCFLKITRFLHWIQACSQIREGFLNFKINFSPNLLPNLTKFSCGWSPIWIHHKIEMKNPPRKHQEMYCDHHTNAISFTLRCTGHCNFSMCYCVWEVFLISVSAPPWLPNLWQMTSF